MKRKIKLLSLVLAISLTFAACSSASSDYDDNNKDYNNYENDSADNNYDNYYDNDDYGLEGNDDEVPYHITEVPDGYIGIYTVEDLKNSGLNENGNYILMNDLDLSSVSDWEGINNNGQFSGNNYVIRNLKSTTGGLFKSANYLYNFILEDVSINVVFDRAPTNTCIGGLVNLAGNVSNCSVSGNISVTYNVNHTVNGLNAKGLPNFKEKHCVGGVAGSTSNLDKRKDTIFSSCVNKANIRVENKIDTPETFVGGVVGRVYEQYIDNCVNYGNVQLITNDSLFTAAGGVCGAAANCNLNCNYGEVYSSGVAGGVIGILSDYSYSYQIRNCYNSGKVTGKHQTNTEQFLGKALGGCAGGIIGYTDYCVEASITNCYNIGVVSGADYCGAIIGGRYEYNGIDIKYCAYSRDSGLQLTGDAAMFADNKAMSDSEMKNLNNYPFTNKDSVWKNGTGDYPYPVFK